MIFDMKYCKGCETGKDLIYFGKNKNSKDGLTYKCLECRREISRIFKINNKDKIIRYNKDYRDNNKKVVKKSKADWLSNNPNYDKEYRRKFHIRDRAAKSSRCAERHANKLNARPIWYERNKIKILYEKAKWLEGITGLKYHVDHIIPLKSDTVCGLHVWANLQILEAGLNISKGNKYDL